MLPTAIVPDQVDLSYLDAQEEAELERQREIVKARNFHEGEQPTFLTDRMKAFLNTDDETTFRMNVTSPVVTAVVERLKVKSLGSANEAVKAWAWDMWTANLMDAIQSQVYEAALRDGEHFVITHWDPSMGLRFTAHPRYTSTDVEDGDGFGCTMTYPDDDDQQPPLYAIKRWSEWVMVDGKNTLRRRATVYYPDRIERFVYRTNHWERFTTEGQPWLVPWKDKAGLPLGIPVIHFKNPGLRCEAKDAWPIQNGINKTYIDFLAAADKTGFGLYAAFGFVPTTDGKPLADDRSNALEAEPGQIIGTTKSKQDADFKSIEAANLSHLMEATQQQVLWLAVVTGTPVGRFMSTRQVAAEGTLKQQDDPLIARVEMRQTLFGNAWEQCLALGLRLTNTFGSDGTTQLDDQATIEAEWYPAQKRSDSEQQTEWTTKKGLGIPEEQLWAEMGYTPEQIKTMQGMPSYKARQALMTSGLNALTQSQEG